MTARQVIIGLDVGTSAVKAVAFDTECGTVASGSHPQKLHVSGATAVHDPDEVLVSVRSALKTCVQGLDGAEVLAIGVTAAMHGLLALDDELRPLTPIVTWVDGRATAEAGALRHSPEGVRLHQATGTPVHPMSPMVKLAWFNRHQPELVGAARWWMGLKDWVLLHLSGQVVTERSSASGSGLLATETGEWHEPALAWAGVSHRELPPVLDVGEALPLSPGVAAAVGLPPGVPVVVGVGDGPAANVGVGALGPGVAGLSIGTSGALRVVVDRPPAELPSALFCYSLTASTWVVGGAVSNGGSVAAWAAERFGVGLDTKALLSQAAAVSPGADGLVALPYLVPERAPLWDATLRGALLGFEYRHTPAHIARAVVEGVCLQLRIVLDRLEQISSITQIRATGGAFTGPLWSDIIASVLERPVAVLDDVEGTALGAAALALVALEPDLALDKAVSTLCDMGSSCRALAEDVVLADTYRRVRLSVADRIDELAAVADLFRV